jgi:2,3,4,5-tetrahydropyridine-2-carboxylate N-succinyltransferase
MWSDAQTLIEHAFEQRERWSPSAPPSELHETIERVITALDQGILRVAEKKDGNWITHQWIKKAVLLSFRLQANRRMDGGFTQ